MRTLTVVGAPIVGASLAIVLSACAPFDPIALPPDWVTCDVRETLAETTATIDHTGALLRLPRGHTLEVPPAAITDTPVTVVFRQMPTRRVQVMVIPSGLNLREPATLTLSYEGRQCDVGEDHDDLRIYRIPTVGPPEQLPVPPRVTPPPGRAVGLVHRFSLFSIARGVGDP